MAAKCSTLDEDERVRFAADVDRNLEDTPESVVEKIWEKWLAACWDLRLLNKPKPVGVERGERNGMLVYNCGESFP